FLNPVQILKANAEEDRGETARLSSFVGAITVGDLVKTTLGPKGMDKILMSRDPVSTNVQVTNDGATILKAIAKLNASNYVLFVEIALVQDNEVGDGTTSVVVLACELLKPKDSSLRDFTRKRSLWMRLAKHSEGLYDELLKIAKTTLGSKIVAQHNELFAKLAVDAVLRLKGSGNLNCIHVIKKLGGRMADSYLDDGFLLEKTPGVQQPHRIENARILIANTPMDTDKIKVFGSRVRVDSVAKVAEMELAEKEKMKDKVNKILSHNINVFINRQLIYNYPEQLFADAGVMAIEHADFEGIERLAHVLGGEIVSTFDNPADVKLGHCKLVEQVMIGEDKLLKFYGVPVGEACTIVIRGSTQQILDEAERSVHDALCPKTIYGGGCAEVIMAAAVQKLASFTPGKESLAIEAFARALLQIPTILADNGGFDSAQLISELKVAHNLVDGHVGDMAVLGVVESYRVKLSALTSAWEAAEMILRVDDIIKAAPRPRGKDRRPC
ncbi:unnamed protein product, partial [Soboliphyme baturini]|uniref:T-complex protein 1 subunit beta n=1 Tax=Soboliphyme baturini TaxID=241478 RepID=A0A183IR90_9BILA